jgi:hypothetical protein
MDTEYLGTLEVEGRILFKYTLKRSGENVNLIPVVEVTGPRQQGN